MRLQSAGIVPVAAAEPVVATVAPFELVLDRCAWFGEDVLWLAPVDDGPLRR